MRRREHVFGQGIGFPVWLLVSLLLLAACVQLPVAAPVEPATPLSVELSVETLEPAQEAAAGATAEPEAEPTHAPAQEPTQAPTPVPEQEPTRKAPLDLAPASGATPIEERVDAACSPTAADMLGPYYEPDAPERTAVGEGYLLNGVVRSAAGCAPLAGAMLEFWMAGPDGVYADDYRATLFSAADGSYAFQSHPAVAYGGRPPHIHIRVTAPGFAELVTQHYPEPAQTGAVFDLVLSPQ